MPEAAERHGLTFWSLLGGYYLALVELHEGVDGALERARSFARHAPRRRRARVAAVVHGCDRRGPCAAWRATRRRSRLLTEATDLADSTGSHFWSAEIARQRGEARLGLGDDGGLEDLRGAVALAEQQGATLLELWARTSLVRAHAGSGGPGIAAGAPRRAGTGSRLVGHQIAAGRAAAAG